MEYGNVDFIIKVYSVDKALNLIVLGSQAKNTVTRMLIGSAAEGMMASVPSDVLVIPPRGEI